MSATAISTQKSVLGRDFSTYATQRAYVHATGESLIKLICNDIGLDPDGGWRLQITTVGVTMESDLGRADYDIILEREMVS